MRMYLARKLITGSSIKCTRNYATGLKLVDITNSESGIATLSMMRTPVNSLNLELLSDLKFSIIEAKKNKSKGIILTSSLPTIFSGGLDIMEMYKPDIKRATEFWYTLQDTWAILYGLDIPVAVAINGASPAGGCLFAMAGEYRAMVNGKHTIGLNETQLGIIAPQWFQDVYIATIGYKQSEKALLKGYLFTPQEALSVGLVDELANDKSDAIAKCENYINYYKKIPGKAHSHTKSMLRQSILKWMKDNKEMDKNLFIQTITQPTVQKGLELYIQSLKQKSA